MMFRVVLVVLALALVPDASAKGWPTPAAGDSPDGSVQIVFTFDDGPNPQTTPQVLDILAKHKIKAVFFLVGEMVETRNKAVPKILQRMLREGHVIASHTMKHKDLCKLKDEAKAAEDIDRGKEAIDKTTRIQTGWFRLPYGVRCDRVERLLEERHLKHFHWDLDPQEWKHGNLDKTVKYITTQLGRAGGREVLLMHDIKKVTVEALPIVLAYIDEENARRQKSRKMPIKILDAPDLAIEQLPTGFTAWLDSATEGMRALPKTVATLLP